MERLYRDSQGSGGVTWDWYRDQLQCSDPLPDLTFVRDVELWNINIHELLTKKLSKSKLAKHWEDQPSEGLVFPLIGTIGILHKPMVIPEYVEGIVKIFDGQRYFIELLTQYAERLGISAFLREG